jgi:hypothetical protein
VSSWDDTLSPLYAYCGPESLLLFFSCNSNEEMPAKQAAVQAQAPTYEQQKLTDRKQVYHEVGIPCWSEALLVHQVQRVQMDMKCVDSLEAIQHTEIHQGLKRVQSGTLLRVRLGGFMT